MTRSRNCPKRPPNPTQNVTTRGRSEDADALVFSGKQVLSQKPPLEWVSSMHRMSAASFPTRLLVWGAVGIDPPQLAAPFTPWGGLLTSPSKPPVAIERALHGAAVEVRLPSVLLRCRTALGQKMRKYSQAKTYWAPERSLEHSTDGQRTGSGTDRARRDGAQQRALLLSRSGSSSVNLRR